MEDDIKRIDIKEFWELGFIQEINRRLLHPCGLALEVIIDTDTGEAKLGGVWDYRDDPEGMAFADDVISASKCLTVSKMLQEKSQVRLDVLNYIIQPVPEVEDAS